MRLSITRTEKVDLWAITHGWPEKNRRLCELAGREVAGKLTDGEAVEKQDLHRLADLRIELMAPIS
jgi:hypothetical protein